MNLKSQKSFLAEFLFLSVLASFFLLFNLGAGSLASWDEAIYAGVAKDIVRSGDWFRLTLGGEAWSDKPPLAIWATAFFYKIFGINEFSSRLFSALCGIGAVLVTYLLGEKLFNRWTGFLGALVLLSSSHYIRFARFGMMDAPLTFFLSLSLYFFWRGRERNRYLIFSGIAIGLAVMTKGFAAFLVFPIVWIYCVWARESHILTRSSYWIGVMIAVGIALPWNLYELTTQGDLFMNDVVGRHLFARTTMALDGHAGNAYFYIRTLVNKYHPWILVGIISAPFFLFKAAKDRFEEFVFVTVWMFFILIVITLVKTKLPWHVLPIYPALSLTVGYVLGRFIKENQKNMVQIIFVLIMALHVPYSHIFDHDYSRTIKGIAGTVRQKTENSQTLYLYSFHESPAAFFYTGRRIAYLDDQNSFLAVAKAEKPFAMLIQENNLKSIQGKLPGLGISVAGSFEDLVLLKK